MYPAFIGAFVVALMLTIVFALLLGKRGPWGSVWTFFLVLFLAILTVAIYITPFGPVYWNIAWIPIVFAGVLFSLLLVAIMPDANQMRDHEIARGSHEEHQSKYSTTHRVAHTSRIGNFFWILILLFVIAIIMGMVSYSY
jgi:hypothetical protein